MNYTASVALIDALVYTGSTVKGPSPSQLFGNLL